MKKWMLTVPTGLLLLSLTACSASAGIKEDSPKVAQRQEIPEAGLSTMNKNCTVEDGFFSRWIEVCDKKTEELEWYMRITGKVVVFVYPDSDYWDGTEYRYNESDGWYYIGTGGTFDQKGFSLSTDGINYYLQMAEGGEHLLLEIRGKAKWLRTFDEMIEAYENIDGSKTEGQWLESAKREYDGDGILTESVEREYDGFGNPIFISRKMDGEETLEAFTYEYDEAGRILSETEIYHQGDQKADATGKVVKWEYDENGNPVRRTEAYIEADEPYSEKVYEYDRYGNCTCETTYLYEELTGQDITEYEYDKQGQVTAKTVTWYEPENWDTEELEYNGYARYEYDAEGRETRYENYTKDGRLRQATEYRYDEKGRPVYEMSGDYLDYRGEDAKTEQIRNYEYDDKNKLYSIVVYWDDMLYMNGSVFLNENGDEVKRVLNLYDGEGNVYPYTEEYTYDENRNRILVEYDNGRSNKQGSYEYEYVYIGGEAADFYEWGEAYLTGNSES